MYERGTSRHAWFRLRGAKQARGRSRILRAVACLLALSGSAGLAGFATASPTGATPSLGQHFVRVGSPPRVPAAASPLGPAPGRQQLEIDVALRPRNPDALANFAREVSTPGSPLYRRYLRPGTFASRFGATTSTLSRTVTALRHLRLHVVSVSSNHLIIKVSSSVATVEHAFSTKLQRYRLSSGTEVYANVSAPRLPAEVAGGIQAIAGLDDLAREAPTDIKGPLRRAGAVGASSTGAGHDAVPGGPEPCLQATNEASSSGPYTADEIAASYGLSGLYSAGDLGSGETVALFELDPFSQPDVETYDECYFGTTQGAAMASPPNLSVVTVDGPQSGLGSDGDAESTLDVEEISGFVPLAKIEVYEGPNTDTGPLDVYNAMITQDTAQVISTSWGSCEAQAGGSAFVAAEANLFEEAAAQGQTVVAAAGDDGSTDCTDQSGNPIGTPAVDDPGSQPYVTSVGAARSPPSARRRSAPPRPCSRPRRYGTPTASAGGGGISSDWAMPAYQSAASPALDVIKTYSSKKPCDAPTGYCREVPDVSADADPATGLVIYLSAWGGWSSIGGTSIASPMWAAPAALANAWPSCTNHSVGFLNPALYEIAGQGPSEYASAFDDITEGENHLAEFANLWQYGATPGYDLASGLGTPIAANPAGGGLVAELCAQPESGGTFYASPTTSTIAAVLPRVKAKRSASSWIEVTLRTALGLPIPRSE